MAVRMILEVKAKPGTGDEAVAFFRSVLPETRAYEGCASVDAHNVVSAEVRDTRE